MKTSIKDIEVEELKLSDVQLEFASEEINLGVSIFATGELVAFWGSDVDDSYDEALINLVDEDNLKLLWSFIRELATKTEGE